MPGIEPPNIFSRRPIWTFWPPKSSKWASWENKTTTGLHRRQLERVGHARWVLCLKGSTAESVFLVGGFLKNPADQKARQNGFIFSNFRGGNLQVFTPQNGVLETCEQFAGSKRLLNGWFWCQKDKLKMSPKNAITMLSPKTNGDPQKMKGNWWGKQAPYFGT